MNFKYMKIGRVENGKAQILEFTTKENNFISIKTTDKDIEEQLKQHKVTDKDFKVLSGCFDNTARVVTTRNNTVIKMHDFRVYSVTDDILQEVDIMDSVLTDLTNRNGGVATIEEKLTEDVKGYTENRTDKGILYYTKQTKSKVSLIIKYN